MFVAVDLLLNFLRLVNFVAEAAKPDRNLTL
jgi:hypothetical protein